jgi:hypothetical protein
MARSEVRMLRQHRMIPQEGVNSLRLTEKILIAVREARP